VCACPVNWPGNGCTEPPQNLTLTATGSDRLEISWKPPPGQFTITLYIILLQGETYHVSPSSDLVMELGTLVPYTTYNCCVAANTTSRPSKLACVTQKTLETGYCILIMCCQWYALKVTRYTLRKHEALCLPVHFSP
jgi:hypothetical protein